MNENQRKSMKINENQQDGKDISENQWKSFGETSGRNGSGEISEGKGIDYSARLESSNASNGFSIIFNNINKTIIFCNKSEK